MSELPRVPHSSPVISLPISVITVKAKMITPRKKTDTMQLKYIMAPDTNQFKLPHQSAFQSYSHVFFLYVSLLTSPHNRSHELRQGIEIDVVDIRPTSPDLHHLYRLVDIIWSVTFMKIWSPRIPEVRVTTWAYGALGLDGFLGVTSFEFDRETLLRNIIKERKKI